MKITLREFILSPRFDPILIGGRTGGRREEPQPSEAIFCTDGSEGEESEAEMLKTASKAPETLQSFPIRG